MAPLPFSYTCSNNCGNAIVDVPPVTGHLGVLIVGTGGGGSLSTYQPASRFCEFQSIEAGIFVALTLLVLGTAVWLLHRRAA